VSYRYSVVDVSYIALEGTMLSASCVHRTDTWCNCNCIWI